MTIAIVDRTNATVWPRLPACARRSAEMGGIIDRLCERKPVIRVKLMIGCCWPMSPIQWQHHSILVRRSTLMPPLRSEIYAWIDGRSWKRCPPRKQPTHPGRVCNPPCLWYGTSGRLPVSKISGDRDADRLHLSPAAVPQRSRDQLIRECRDHTPPGVAVYRESVGGRLLPVAAPCADFCATTDQRGQKS